MRGSTLLDLILREKKEKTHYGCEGWGSFGCRDCEIVDLRILRERNKAKIRNSSLNLRKAHYGFFKDLLLVLKNLV